MRRSRRSRLSRELCCTPPTATSPGFRGCAGRTRWPRTAPYLDFQYHRHNQRTPLRLARNVALQVGADLFFDHAVVGFLFGARGIEGLHDDLAGALDEAIFAGIEAARYNLGRGFDPSGELVDCDDRHHKAVFAKVTAVFNY